MRSWLLLHHPGGLLRFSNFGLCPILKWRVGLRVSKRYPSRVIHNLLPNTTPLFVVLIIIQVDRRSYVLEALKQEIPWLCIWSHWENISEDPVVHKIWAHVLIDLAFNFPKRVSEYILVLRWLYLNWSFDALYLWCNGILDSLTDVWIVELIFLLVI